MNETGTFIISLDFELLWGVRDTITSDSSYGKNILGVWDILPQLLYTFEQYEIQATFATVGFMFASNKNELVNYFPKNLPKYTEANLSPYNGHIDLLKNSDNDKFHFAPSLINEILLAKRHEISTHTFSHYYCLEDGQNKEDFKDDIISAIKIANDKNVDIKSIVFPRNQCNASYLNILKELGINSYRGNEKSWFYKASNGKDDNLFKRIFRLIDSYINLSGHNCYSDKELAINHPINIPSSRFLRPFSTSLKYFEKLRLKRILNSMTYAAKNNKVFHLWWHPHNFGINQKENIDFLNKILDHYSYLKTKYQFESLTMNNYAEKIKNTNAK